MRALCTSYHFRRATAQYFLFPVLQPGSQTDEKTETISHFSDSNRQDTHHAQALLLLAARLFQLVDLSQVLRLEPRRKSTCLLLREVYDEFSIVLDDLSLT